jgi:hypothetical protein
MAEVVAVIGVVASVTNLIDFTEDLFSRGFELIKIIKDADESISKVLKEVNSFTGILHSLRNVVKQFEYGTSSEPPTLQIAHLNACYGTLRKIQEIIDKLRLSRQTPTESRERSFLSQRIRWPLSIKETTMLIDELQKHKATLTLALNADSM